MTSIQSFASTPQETVVATMLDAVVAGDGETIGELIAEDAVWTFPGNFDFSGEHNGKPAIFEGLFGAAGKLFEPGCLAIDMRHLVSTDDVVVVEYTARNKMRNGADYVNDFVFVFEVSGGQIKKVREYLDTLHMRDAMG
jgi:ketosteroid isomerase-like protein